MTASPASLGRARRRPAARGVLLVVLALAASACATTASFRDGQRAERERDYDQAVMAYTRALEERPHDRNIQLSLERARLRAAQVHYARGRALARQSRWEDALAEYQIAYDLNPTMGDIERELREMREAVRTELAAREEGRTAIEELIDRTHDAAPAGLELPQGIALPESLVFRDASTRAIFSALAQFADVTVVFDPQFQDVPISVDLRGTTFDAALETVAGVSGNFFRVSAPRTITIIPDTPPKRREYMEEVVRTFYLSNADPTETIDMLRLVIDLRRLAVITATNAISIKDTPARVEAAGRLIRTIDKARAEVVIEVQLLEVDRQMMRDYGLEFAASGADAAVGAGNDGLGLTVDDVRRLSGSDLFVANPMSLLVNLLETHSNTRILANPHLRTSDGVAAEAHFGERVPVPVTNFVPFATGGISQQPITSFNYENIGVNINIVPRVHHNDEVSLSIEVDVSNQSGTGYNDLPQFGNRSITTMLRLRDGETNILAGLIRDDERETLSGIPGLNRLPIIGRLFGSTKTMTQETDILLTLRPHIIRGLDLAEDDLLPFRVDRDDATALAGGVSPGLRFEPQANPERLTPLPTGPPREIQRPVLPPEPPPPSPR